MQLSFQNKYGSVTFRRASDLMHVRDIRGVNIDDCYKFDIDTAEKIALITDNRRLQIAPTKVDGKWRCYVILHESTSTGVVAAIDAINYVGNNPAQEIQNARRSTPEACI